MEDESMVKDNSVELVVCVLAFNHGKFITQAINSILSQTFNNFIIIISDDASTDNTQEVLDEFKDKTNIKIFRQSQNIGITKNAKFLYSKALEFNPKYIATLEGDDFWIDNRKLEKQFSFMEESYNQDVVLTCGGFGELDEEEETETKISFDFINKNDVWIDIASDQVLLSWKTKYLTYLIRTSAFKKIQYLEFDYLVDYVIVYELNKLGRICFLNEELGMYRRHMGGNFGKKSELHKYKIELKIYRSLLKINRNDNFLWTKYRKIAKKLNWIINLKYFIEHKTNSLL